jgi:hypothetical protein
LNAGNIIRKLLIVPVFIAGISVAFSQVQTQTIKGIITDKDTRSPLAGANVIVINSDPLIGVTADENGKFRLIAPVGRISLKATFLGYEDLVVRDILVSSGKEIDLSLEMREKLISATEIFVTTRGGTQAAINPMAAVSSITVRANDALRYAGGFYDPSRIVNSFAGVVTANNDESNDIVIRGNSSRGLLWRLEGIEIPNPNHFSDGQGGSGGAYSAITSNVISNFDFFTGAFPAEYGNAMSGVMDLNLRKGNADKYEFAFQTGMIGAELAAEGPLAKNKGSSFLLNARYANFNYLSNLGLIDLGETNYAPRSSDLVFNFNFPSGRWGNINAFGFFGKSSIGKIAEHNISAWQSDRDRWEEFETIQSAAAGIKHIYSLPRGNSYMKSVLAFTWYRDSYSEGFIDSSYNRTNSYYYDYKYPSLRYSFMMNSKLDSKAVIRYGANVNILGASMEDMKMNQSGQYTTLVAPEGSGLLLSSFIQIKNRVTEKLEFNSGCNVIYYSVNGDMNVEPRLGLKWQVSPGSFFTSGLGLHSRIESFPVYYNLVRNLYGEMVSVNRNLNFSQSLHFVAGVDLSAGNNMRVKIEGYNQQLFNIPIIYNKNSRYSAINSSEELPSAKLENEGKGYNRGIEFTAEKNYSDNYYFLFTLSLFTSKYLAGDNKWYNSFYNNSFVSNLLAGKDFYFGLNKRNSFGINAKMLYRGGYRYTPVDMARTIKYKRIIYDSSHTYGAQLPDFFRLDAGMSYRLNNPTFSFVVMLDVQNLTGRKNVFRKKFNYENNHIVETRVYSLGTVPVVNLRIEF